MDAKEKLLLVFIALVVAFSFLFSHYWTFTVFVVQRVVACSFMPFQVFSLLAAWIAGTH